MTRRKPTASTKRAGAISARRLAEMAEEATIDAYGEAEQICGWSCALDEHVEVPFETNVLGDAVVVEAIEQRGDARIVAICRRGRARQVIDVLDLPIPSPIPPGCEWIEAYRHWRKDW